MDGQKPDNNDLVMKKGDHVQLNWGFRQRTEGLGSQREDWNLIKFGIRKWDIDAEKIEVLEPEDWISEP